MNIGTTNQKTRAAIAALAIVGDSGAMGSLAYLVIDALNNPSFTNTLCASVVAGVVYAGREYTHAQLRSHININTEKVNIGTADAEMGDEE